MTKALAFTIARVATAGLLVWAGASPSLNSHLFLRLAIFAVAAWGVGRAIKEEPGLFVFLFYVLVAVAFNPLGFRAQKETWVLIDIASGILLLLSIFILDSGSFETALETPGGKKVRALISIFFGIAWTLFGGLVIYNSATSIASAAKLKISGKQTQAGITRVTHALYHTNDTNNDSRTYDIYVTEYTFQTEDGRLIAGSSELFDNPASKLSADEFQEKYSNGFEVDKNDRIPLQVEYEKANPTNNRALSSRMGTGDSIFVAICVAFVFGLCPVLLGFKVCKEHLPGLLAHTEIHP